MPIPGLWACAPQAQDLPWINQYIQGIWTSHAPSNRLPCTRLTDEALPTLVSGSPRFSTRKSYSRTSEGLARPTMGAGQLAKLLAAQRDSKEVSVHRGLDIGKDERICSRRHCPA